MFQKYLIPQHSVQLQQSDLISLSFTELSKEPSILHSHPYFEVLIPQNNFGILLCGDKKITMQKNILYIIPSNITHSEINEHDINKAKYFAIKISHTIYVGDEYPFSIDIGNEFEKLNTFLSNAYEAFTTSDITFALLNLACFSYSFNKLLEEQNVFHTPSANPELIYASFTKEIEYYLKNNYAKNIKIEDLASQYNISHSALIKNFKTSFGFTPKEYIIKLRLEKAADLLKSSNYSISLIASECGFFSPAYFTQQFRKKFGATPKAYRKQKKA